MKDAAKAIVESEKTWLLNRCGLVPDFDDDVMDQQKWAAGAFMLAQALVAAEAESNPPSLVSIPLYKCRQIMTRVDFTEQLDELNIISIDPMSDVRASSVPMMSAFRQLVNEPTFKADLLNVCDRIDAVESLNRTREIVWKKIDGEFDGTLNVKTSLVIHCKLVAFYRLLLATPFEPFFHYLQ